MESSVESAFGTIIYLVDAKGGNNVVHFSTLRGYVPLTANVISDMKSVPFLLIEGEGNASMSKWCLCCE